MLTPGYGPYTGPELGLLASRQGEGGCRGSNYTTDSYEVSGRKYKSYFATPGPNYSLNFKSAFSALSHKGVIAEVYFTMPRERLSTMSLMEG